jgi:hypothetical protein
MITFENSKVHLLNLKPLMCIVTVKIVIVLNKIIFKTLMVALKTNVGILRNCFRKQIKIDEKLLIKPINDTNTTRI